MPMILNIHGGWSLRDAIAGYIPMIDRTVRQSNLMSHVLSRLLGRDDIGSSFATSIAIVRGWLLSLGLAF